MGHLQLLSFQLPPGAPLEGQLLGEIERAESGGTLRIVEVLFVGTDLESGELVALAERGRGQGGLVRTLTGFRLDAGERRRATEKALRAFGDGELLRRIASALPPGGAVAAMLVEHACAAAVDDAVGRTGGGTLLTEFVDEPGLAAAAPRLLAALEGASAPSA